MNRKRNRATQAISALQRMVNRDRAEREADVHELGPVVNDCAAQHGDYVPVAKTGEMRHAMKNCGGTPIARWERAGLITEHQLAGIAHVRRLWEITDSSARLVANLDRTVFGSPGNGHEAEIEARQDLHRIRDYFHPTWWSIFENVCRFDEPAGVAGSKLSADSSTASAHARLVVCMVADFIYMKEPLRY